MPLAAPVITQTLPSSLPATSSLLGRVEDVLDLRVMLERVGPELAPDTRLLEASERRRHPHGAVRVDRDHARVRSRGPRAAPGRRRPTRSSRRGRRSCRWRARSRRPRRRTGSRRRRVRRSPRWRRGRSSTSAPAPSARTRSPGRPAPSRGSRRGASSGTYEPTVSSWSAEISGPISVASSSGSPTTIAVTARSSAAMKSSIAPRCDQDPRACAAVLPGVAEHRARGRRGGRVEVGVGEDDVGRLAAELERHALDRAPPRRPRSAGRPRSSP